ncbi:MAG TPA: STAS domain-containing protein [Nitrospirota bacterium]
MKNFTLDTMIRDGVAVLHPHGYLNNIVAEKLEKECGEFMKQGVQKILLNFNDIEYINSIGISILLGVIESIRTADGALCFSNLSNVHSETFEMIGLRDYMQIFSNEDEALAYLLGGTR